MTSSTPFARRPEGHRARFRSDSCRAKSRCYRTSYRRAINPVTGDSWHRLLLFGPDAPDAERFGRGPDKWDLARATKGEPVDLREFAVDGLGEGKWVKMLAESVERREPLLIDSL